MITSFLTSNATSLGALAAIVGTLLLGLWRLLSNAKKEDINEQIVTQSKQDKKNHEIIINDVKRAAEAGARVGTASADSLRNDPFNRDNPGRR